jgi:hypothetical protein
MILGALGISDISRVSAVIAFSIMEEVVKAAILEGSCLEGGKGQQLPTRQRSTGELQR